MSLKITAAPGQKRSSSVRSWFASATLGLDQILTRAGQRPQRLGLIAVGNEDAEPVAVGPRELAQHERVEPVRLPARGTKPRAGGRDLVGMDRHHPQPGVQQPLDQQSIRAFDRDQLHLQPHKRFAQGRQPALVVREPRGQDRFARFAATSMSCFSDAQSTLA